MTNDSNEREEEVSTLPTTEELDAAEAAAKAPAAEPEVESNVPEKYRGKSTEDLVAMLSEQERFAGKQSQEVGDLRRSVDSLIQAQLAAPTQAAAPAAVEEEINFFDDPEKAMDAKIANHPEVRAARESAAQFQRMTSTNQLRAKHPDMDEIVSDDSFIGWCKDSPIRTSLLQNAHQNYHYESADELFSTWKERKGLVKQQVAVEKKERSNQVKAASTGARPSNAAPSPVKKYRRGDIINLMNTDPERYARMSAEIMAAYAEGRVIN